MWDVAYYLAVVILLAAAVIASAFAVRAYMTGAGPMDAVSKLFGPKPERRLDIVEQSNLDGRRRLILIRRDDVEHLIMTGWAGGHGHRDRDRRAARAQCRYDRDAGRGLYARAAGIRAGRR